MGNDMALNSTVSIPRALIATTVRELRTPQGVERVILWLGQRGEDGVRVTEVFVPMQIAALDYFQIPPAGMSQLMSRLQSQRLMVAAQVHTHPLAAFHSEADDDWAIVRHVGALSLVVPHFCTRTTAESFVSDALVFQLNRENEFTQTNANQAYRIL